MGRKNLNDVLSNDRSISRAAQSYGSSAVNYFKAGSNGDAGSWAEAKYEKCANTHPPLPIKKGDKTYEIFGGSCINPIVKDANIFMGFDRGMQVTTRAFPWNPGVEVLFPIADMGVPKSVEQFQKMVAWTAEQLESGKKIHCGCIGGHGRTGMFLTALVRHMSGEEDAIAYVRKHYCERAVESREQVNWLNEHFGIKKAKGYKEGLKSSVVDYYSDPYFGGSGKGKGKRKALPRGAEEIMPLGRDASIFRGS